MSSMPPPTPRRLRVMTLVGTRPEVIKLSRVIAELDAHTDHVLVHSGQNYDYELNEVFFADLAIRKPDHFLDAAGETAAETIGQVISRADRVMAAVEPDALLLYGDTNTCLAVIAAKRRKIPVFHMEAGNRCFDDRVPEEINRRLVDHLSDINLPLSEHARRYLLAEGRRPETVIKVGSPMREVLGHHRASIERSDVLQRLEVVEGEYFLVSAHREENVDNPKRLEQLLATLDALSETGMPVIVSTHPRTRTSLATLDSCPRTRALADGVRFLAPFGYFDYVRLQMGARCVLSDSGTLTEESSILGFPAVMLREAHERPEGMDQATVVMSALRPDAVMRAVALVVAHARTAAAENRPFRLVPDYESDDVSRKVVRILHSYVDYVNRTVWFDER